VAKKNYINNREVSASSAGSAGQGRWTGLWVVLAGGRRRRPPTVAKLWQASIKRTGHSTRVSRQPASPSAPAPIMDHQRRHVEIVVLSRNACAYPYSGRMMAGMELETGTDTEANTTPGTGNDARGYSPGSIPHRFAPGNTLAKRTLKVRVKAEAERLIADFVAAYGRAPNHAEAAQIGNCALLIAKLAGRGPRGKALTPEDISRMSSVLLRTLRRVGLSSAPTRANAAAPRRRGALEVANRGEAK
jgi:hypothetical protein